MVKKMRAAAVLFFIFSTGVWADPFVSVGPTEMSYDDFKALKNMVAGNRVAGRTARATSIPEMVAVGPTSIPATEYAMLLAMVEGTEIRDDKDYGEHVPVFDLGIFVMSDPDYQTLQEKVSQGPLWKTLSCFRCSTQ